MIIPSEAKAPHLDLRLACFGATEPSILLEKGARLIKPHPLQPATRRQFLGSAAAISALAVLRDSSQAQSSSEPVVSGQKIAADPQRPQFHLLPARNWMNDPNGPIYFNGNYHMFFQYNPQAAVWGDMSWYHSVSPDMIHWKHLPVAMTPTPGSPDAYGCFSGSAIQVGKRVYAIYTGTKLSSHELATLRDGEDKIQESQCLAYSDDPQLIRWTKLPQPVIPLPPPGLPVTGFRDPSIWRAGDWYYMTVGSGVAKQGGCVLLYRSKAADNLKTWEYLHPLISGQWTGHKTANPCDDGEMWECPDFFALDGGHVLIYSTESKVYWQSGVLDPKTMLFHPGKQGELDLGSFYAPKTQLDAGGRRILWGWIQEARSENAMRAAGWSGMMSLPRVMRLDSDGTLRLTILPETSMLRAGPTATQQSYTGVAATLRNASGEFLCTAPRATDLVLTITNGATEFLRITYSADTHSFQVAGKQIVLQPGDTAKIHAFLDASVMEVFLGERTAYTKRFYPEGSDASTFRISATSKGKPTLNAWSVRPISTNRLTDTNVGA